VSEQLIKEQTDLLGWGRGVPDKGVAGGVARGKLQMRWAQMGGEGVWASWQHSKKIYVE
jgi:hypothetical protein